MNKKIVEIYRKFANKWVALNESNDKVITSGTSIVEVEEKLSKTKEKAAVITFILPPDKNFAPYAYS